MCGIFLVMTNTTESPSSDWRIEEGLIRYPEDNDVISVPIDAIRRPLSDREKIQSAYLGIVATDIAYTRSEEQGCIIVWHDPLYDTSDIIGVPKLD